MVCQTKGSKAGIGGTTEVLLRTKLNRGWITNRTARGSETGGLVEGRAQATGYAKMPMAGLWLTRETVTMIIKYKDQQGAISNRCGSSGTREGGDRKVRRL